MAITAFDEIVKTLHQAVIEAQHTAEGQYQTFIDRYFTYQGSGTELRAKTVKIAVRSLRPDAHADAHDVVEVPLVCLAAPSAIKIKELTVEFETQIGDIAPATNAPAAGAPKERSLYVDISAPVSLSPEARKSSMAKVTISFQGTDPPEGVLRINDLMLKRLP